jgi:hypothetical protein
MGLISTFLRASGLDLTVNEFPFRFTSAALCLDDGGIFAFGVSDAGSRQAEEEDYDEMRVFWFHSLVCVGFY